MRRSLFICGKARMRSPTAADVARERCGIETDFAGLSADADEKLSSEQTAWADVVFVMDRRCAGENSWFSTCQIGSATWKTAS